MRMTFDNRDSSAFRCCLCCHVRTGTVLLGVWHLLANLMVVTFLVYSSINPDVLRPTLQKCDTGNQQGFELIAFDNGSGFKVAEAQPYTYQDPYINRMTREDLCVGFAITLCTLTVTLFLLYGTIRNRPGYLLPFFCLQVFDFCLSCLTVVGYFSYAPNFKVWLKEQGLSCMPGLDSVANIQGDWLMLLCLLFLVLFLSLKAYMISMVWACYKYLQMRLVHRSSVREYSIDPDTEVCGNDKMLLPPKYEEAIKMPVDQNPPPPYTST
ncbi:lysosomal-associated transmembrane protein 4A-like isoform X1 [Pecten maximus]|uniref:lysosomal-associated transmembrane protein 4A-like isoform X1 n=1 Tax=Pecten maximus TaxID=6579 RepID=UPI0014591871|nr:lysosomal-associated transmembrane protein 4A-like isoform X1 [Pecten maximus]